MKSQRAGLRTASVVLGLIGLGHLWRLLARVDVRISHHAVPMWPSFVVLLIAAAMSIWLWALSKQAKA